MKRKLSIFTIFCVLATCSYAQLFTPGGVTLPTTGGFGIGIGQPQPGARLNIYDNGNNSTTLKLDLEGSQQAVIGGGFQNIQPAFAMRVTRKQFLLAGVTDVFSIDFDGKVKIGSSLGSENLSVGQSAAIYRNSNNHTKLRYSGDQPEFIWTTSSNRNFRFRNGNNNTTPISLSPTGKVGINTQQFQGNHSLYVKGETISESFVIQKESNWGVGVDFVRIWFNENPNLTWNSTIGQENFQFRSGANTPLTLSPTGKVGVNTENFVGTHSLYIKGTTIAEEIFVKLEYDWSDYVFNEDYYLIPLEELEVFITQNKHLPGMPTADEIAETGVPIGEVERILTEKVEELTLHLIEMNKEIKALREEITTLKVEK